ncbi:CBS domain-containing protein [Trinickia sp. NRRL B-1857]|uniref:CBS domain-containing protein n=1 Tax=Trinickia sp. NRRL B-1857 TaxID=3162879 RepID=UPI003D2D6878
MKVEEFRSPHTVHIPMTRTVRDAAKQMREQHVGALIVTEDGPPLGRVVGIVTDRDIAIKAVVQAAEPDDLLVADIMQTHVLSIEASADIADALQMMASHGVRRLAVTERDGTLVGVLSLDDVLDAMARDWALLATVVRAERHRELTGSVQSVLPAA